MPLQVDARSVKIDVNTSGAINAVTVFNSSSPNPYALCHLTRGAVLSGTGFNFGPAIRVVATVDAITGPGENTLGWAFNFLQFGNLMARSATWGGRTPAEGSVTINYAIGPAFGVNPSLDSTLSESPFVGLNAAVQNTVPEGANTRNTITREMGDHPNSKQILKITNLSTNCINFLQNMRLDVGFTTAFVVRGPDNVIQFLAHFTWHVVYDARFTWAGSTCSGVMTNGRLDVGPVVNGRPPDGTLQRLLNTPVGPFYNDLCLKATSSVAKNQQPPNYVEITTRDPSIPANFYT